MGTPTQYYVDPSLGSDTGDGSVSTPWGRASGSVVQHALDTITQDTANGDQINIKAGSADTLSSPLTLVTYGTPAYEAPLIFRGYATVANDGDFEAQTGLGEINCGGGAMFAAANNYTHLIDLHIHTAGSAAIITLNTYAQVFRCKIHGTTGNGVITSAGSLVRNCWLYDISGVAINTGGYSAITDNFITGTPTTGILFNNSQGTYCLRNILSLSGAANGIGNAYHSVNITHNTVYNAASSGTPNGIARSANSLGISIANNIVSGFTGGTGISGATSRHYFSVMGNAVYNCGTPYALDDTVFSEDNEELGSTPFAGTPGTTFSTRFTDFAPVSAVQGSAYPSGCRLDKGAVQHADPAGGGGGLILPGLGRFGVQEH